MTTHHPSTADVSEASVRDLLIALHGKVDGLATQFAAVERRQREDRRALDDLLTESGPILRAMMDTATERLDVLDRQGWFAFGRELMGVGQRIVEGTSPEDVRRLGENILAILDTVKSITQPDVLRLVGEATDVLHAADQVPPIGLYGMMKVAKEDDVRKGFGVLMAVLRRVGQSAQALQGGSRSSGKKPLAAMLAPRRERPDAPKVLPPKTAPPAPTGALACKPMGSQDKVDLASWTREGAIEVAASLGIAMTDAHWAIVEFARKDYAEVGATPNIRRITTVLGLATKELYALFPKAPGRTMATIAGLPKPGGCL